MMPPPAMTTSALSTQLRHVRSGFARGLYHPPHLEDHLQRSEGRDVSVVEGRRYLNDVEAHELRAVGGALQQLQRLAARQTSRRRDLGARRKRGVEDVDVERYVDLLPGQPLSNSLRRTSGVARDVRR